MGSKSGKSQPGVLFGFIFFIAGLAIAYFVAGNMVVGYIASANWEEVPAKIHHVRLVGGTDDGSTTRTVEGSFSYEFDGVSYQNDRVSLSSGSDSFGQYWQELERSLLADQSSNEALAIVNPNDPTEAVLDRTLRWQSVLFGMIFLIGFSGVGGFIMWSSLPLLSKRNGEVQLQNDHKIGIPSNQKSGYGLLVALGGFFFAVGLALSAFVLPEALRNREFGALGMLIFVIGGAGILYHAISINRAYKRFGPTPLMLDPPQPGVGGQLGGRFNIDAPGIGYKTGPYTQLHARLTCSRKRKSKDNTSYSVLWREEAPVYLKQTASGVDTSFLFEIPDNCAPSAELNQNTSIEWNVSVEGEFDTGDLGKFERDWQVVVEDRAAQASHVLSIPQSFIQNNEQLSDDRAKNSALEQVPVTVEGRYINIHSTLGLRIVERIVGVLFGVVFLGIGIITVMQSWLPGYLFLLFGLYATYHTVKSLGKSINVRIDKVSKLLHTQERWFGFVYARHQSRIVTSGQFKLKLTLRSISSKKLTERYALNFHSDEKTIRIADGIEGKFEAAALKDAIVDFCFDQ